MAHYLYGMERISETNINDGISESVPILLGYHSLTPWDEWAVVRWKHRTRWGRWSGDLGVFSGTGALLHDPNLLTWRRFDAVVHW